MWRGIADIHDLDVAQEAQLLEACRAKDRLDQLDRLLRTDVSAWEHRALDKANVTANVMKQLLAALRLPDEVTGKRPAYHGKRGPEKPTVPRGVSSIDRARAKVG